MKICLGHLLIVLCMSCSIPVYAAARGPMLDVNSDSGFTIYYGDAYYQDTDGPISTWSINQNTINALSQFDVVVLQPNQPHFTPEIVKVLKDNGVQYVLGYISIGEDFINDAIESPLSNGSGMQQYNASSGALDIAHNNTLQSFYIDVDSQNVTYNNEGTIVSVETTARLTPDGLPDLNPHFLGYMVYPDANWRWVLDNMRIGTADVAGRSFKAGLKQIANERDTQALRDRSGNFGFDGFFLDTIDTAGPYNAAGWYPWALNEMHNTVKYISDQYATKTILANRGAFFFSPGLKSPLTQQFTIDKNIRSYINGFLFESFRYDSDPYIDGPGGISEFFNENRYNLAPKVLSEANRDDGFTVFSLEYESGRPNIVTDAFDIDIRQLGFVGYLTQSRSLNTIDADFIALLPDQQNDLQGPTWETSGHLLYNTPNDEVRTGVQSVMQTDVEGQVAINWDIAIDQSYPITYDLVITKLSDASQTTLTAIHYQSHSGWQYDPVTYSANEYIVSDLEPGTSYHFKIIAVDAHGNKNSEDNGQTITLMSSVSNPIVKTDILLDGLLTEWSNFNAFPGDPSDVVGVSPAGHIAGSGNQANWRNIQMAHTTDSSELYMAYTNETNIYISWGFQVFIDSDDDLSTGFKGSFGGINTFPIGADYLIEGINVYQYSGTGSDWHWEISPTSGGYTLGRVWSGHTGETYLPLHWIGNPTGSFSFVCFGNNTFYGHTNEYDWYPDNAHQGGFFRYKL